MGLRDFVDHYIVSLNPSAAKGKVSLGSAGKVSELDVPPVDEARLAQAVGGDVSFDKVFAAAQIPVPAHGFTVEKVGEMLRHPKLAGMAKEAKAAAVLVALEASGAKIESVIAEAARKDKALDVFERVQREHAVQLVTQKDEENKKFRAQIAANDKAAAEIAAQLGVWQKKKAAKEADLYDIVSHFTTANPITVEQPAAPEPEPAPAAKVKVTDLSKTLDQ